MQFKTELKQLLHLILLLYSHKDIFLRELINNASGTVDRVRFQSLTDADLLEGNGAAGRSSSFPMPPIAR